MSLWRYVKAILVLPVMVTIIIPSVILSLSDRIALGWGLPYPYWLFPALFGCILIGIGLVVGVTTIMLFARLGEGTLAPWEPTQKLVVHGIYRYVRNPMISGVVFMLIGETILLGSLLLFGWCLLFVIANSVYIPLWEERGLMERFGEPYLVYKRHVPRWIPRFTPWEASTDASKSRRKNTGKPGLS